ncbi:MAG: YadA-like family protein [Moraxellaceae bacterium]|nr:YadA-like family protein [Moraxellaceae bacterium]
MNTVDAEGFDVVIGTLAQSVEGKSVVIGKNAQAHSSSTVVLGKDAKVKEGYIKAVALGDASIVGEDEAATDETTKPFILNKVQHTPSFAGAPAGDGYVVSVGGKGVYRQITNVAAGEISKTSTDAINGSQLFSIAETLDTKINNIKPPEAPLVFSGNTNNDTYTPKRKNPLAKGNITGAFYIKQADGKWHELEGGEGTPVKQGGRVLEGNDTRVTEVPATPIDGTARKLGEKLAIIGSKTGQNLSEDTSNEATAGVYKSKNLQTVVTNGQVQIQMADKPEFSQVTVLNKGTADTDAVNVSQIKNYFHVNENDVNQGAGDATTNLGDIRDKAGATGAFAVTAGVNAQATGANAMAMGVNAKAKDKYSIAIGDQAVVEQDGTTPDAVASVAIGRYAKASAHESTAIGGGENEANAAKAKHQHSVAIGAYSETEKATITNDATIGTGANAVSYSGFATRGNGATNTFAIGNQKYTRQLINVSAGRINADSTDAINGSQLYSIAKTLQEKIPQTTPLALETADGTPTGTPTGKVATPTEPNKIATAGDIANAINNSGWKLQEKGIDKDLVTAGNIVDMLDGIGTTVSVDNSTANNTKIKYSVAVDDKTTHITGKDKNGNDIVKVGDKYFTVGADGKPTTTEIPLADVAKTQVSAKTGDIVDNGDGTTGAGTNPNALTTAKDVSDAINNAGFKVKTNVNDNGNNLVKMGNTLEINQGKNIDIERIGKKFTIKTKDDVEFNNITVGPVKINKDTGIDAGKKNISNVKSNLPGTADNPIAPADVAKANKNQPAPNLTPAQKQNAATVDDVLNSGWNLQTAGNRPDGSTRDDNVDFVKPYETVEFEAGAGLYVENTTDGKKSVIKFRRAGTDEIDKKPIDGVADTNNGSVIIVPSTTNGQGLISAKNVAKAINNSGWNLLNNGTQKDLVNPADKVNFINGAGTTAKVVTAQDGKSSTVTYDVNADDTTTEITGEDKDGNKVVKVGNKFFRVNPVTGKPTTTEVAPDKIAKTQVSAKTSKVEVDPNTGKAKELTGDEAKAIATAGDVAKAINDASHKITANNSDFIASATNGTKVMKAGEELTLEAGKNLNIQKEADKFILSTKMNVEFDTVLAKKGITIGEGDIATTMKPTATTALDKNGNQSNKVPAVDLGGSTFTGVASNLPKTTNKAGNAGTTSQQAPTGVVGSNVATVDDVLNAGWNLQNNSIAKDFVKPYDTVDFANGQGTTARVSVDNNKVSHVRYDVNPDDVTTQITGEDKDGNKVVKVGDKFFRVNPVTGKPTTTEVAPDKIAKTQVSAKTTNLTPEKANNAPTGRIATPAQPNSLVTAGTVANAINNAGFKVKTANGENSTSAFVKMGDTVQINEGVNIDVVQDGKNFSIKTKPVVAFQQVSTGDVVMSAATGINAGGMKIQGVAKGTAPTDAVNVSQLKQMALNFDNKLNEVADDANAGTASAMAMAGLPQAFIEGKSMAVGATSYYNGQGAVAVGISKVSDNGRWVLKTGVSADTVGEVGGTVGAGVHF